MIADIDLDGSGTIDFDEFVEMVCAHARAALTLAPILKPLERSLTTIDAAPPP